MGNDWLNVLGWWIVATMAVFACLKMLYANPNNKFTVWLQLIIYYAKYWVLWLWYWSLWHFWLEPQAFYAITAGFALWYLYSSWIEPNRLQVRYQTIKLGKKKSESSTVNNSENSVRLAVIGDVHIGIFSSKNQLAQVVQRLNQLEVDAVLVTGDWLYHPSADIMGKLLVLKALNKPCFSVLSNADHEQLQQIEQRYQNSKGADYLLLNERLPQVLQIMGITLLGHANKSINLAKTHLDQKAVKLLGFSNGITSLPPVIAHKKYVEPTIILTHDIKQFLANSLNVQYLNENTLVIAGQSHGGQVNIPFLTPWLVKAVTGNTTIQGLTEHNIDKVMTENNLLTKRKLTSSPIKFYSWTNTGIGMTGLPLRFNCPPRIDVLTITWAV